MPIETIGVITLLTAVLAIHRGKTFAIRTFVPSTLFGAAAAINAPGVGSIQPAHLLLGVVAGIVFVDRENLGCVMRSLRFPTPGFWLTCTWVYGVIGAIFVPRIFATQFLVNAIGVGDYGVGFAQVPLGPTSGNVTQSVYFTADLVCFLVCCAVVRTPSGYRTVALALVGYAVGDTILALVDLATYYTGTTYLLDFMRNATYVIFVDEGASGTLKRIIGSFTEASAFAGATIGVFGFSLRLWIENIWPRATMPIALMSLSLLMLSTSTTAYVALPVCLGLFYLTSVWRMMRAQSTRSVALFVSFAPLLGVLCLLAIMLHPATYQALGDFFDGMVLQKSSSQSGLDRGRINLEAWQNFLDSGGIGTGIGGVRTSSFVLAVLANLGLVGGLAYAAFLAAVLRPPERGDDEFVRGIRAAARTACAWLLVTATVSGALIDLGLPFFIFAALACTKPSHLRNMPVQPVKPRLGDNGTALAA